MLDIKQVFTGIIGFMLVSQVALADTLPHKNAVVSNKAILAMLPAGGRIMKGNSPDEFYILGGKQQIAANQIAQPIQKPAAVRPTQLETTMLASVEPRKKHPINLRFAQRDHQHSSHQTVHHRKVLAYQVQHAHQHAGKAQLQHQIAFNTDKSVHKRHHLKASKKSNLTMKSHQHRHIVT